MVVAVVVCAICLVAMLWLGCGWVSTGIVTAILRGWQDNGRNQDSGGPLVSFRACWSSYALWGSIGLATVVVAVVNALDDVQKWPGIVLAVGAFGAVLLWFSRFRVSITADRLSYNAPFQKAREIARADVGAVEVHIGLSPPPNRRLGHTIIVHSATSNDVIVINTKPFSRKDIDQILSFLGCLSNRLQFDRKAPSGGAGE